MFVIEMSVEKIAQSTGRAETTVSSWFETCRAVCTDVLADRGKMVATDAQPIQIDAARYAGRRKYNRGRILEGDAPSNSNDEEADILNMRNHGARIDGLLIFGLRYDNDCLYFVVERRDKDIKRESERGSVIHSDEWRAYSSLTTEGFSHETVNHQQHFVNQTTGTHTQAVERSWLDAKISILTKKRGVPLYQLQSHLDHYCWQMKRKMELD